MTKFVKTIKEPLKSIQENSDQLQEIFDIHGITWEEQNNIKHKGKLIPNMSQ